MSCIVRFGKCICLDTGDGCSESRVRCLRATVENSIHGRGDKNCQLCLKGHQKIVTNRSIVDVDIHDRKIILRRLLKTWGRPQ